MLNFATPEECGISSRVIEKYIRKLDENGYAMHSILMSRYGKIFVEGYWHPYNEDSHQRMNSVTKSFVGIAIGFLLEEGKLKITDKITQYFDKDYFENSDELIKELTIENLLTMRTTAMPEGHWVRDRENDRIKLYFDAKAHRAADTLFRYDSSGSYLLGVIVEKLSGKTLVEYLKDKCLKELNFSEKTDCIKCPDGSSWGDSGLLCRVRDLHTFAKFVQNKGVWNEKKLMNEEFIEKATSRISDTNLSGFDAHNTFGYGYQIWKTYEDGFAFFGMGDQLVICIPEKDFIFVCTADNQGNAGSRPVIMNSLYHDIIKELSPSPLSSDPEGLKALREYTASLNLVSIKGSEKSPVSDEINEKIYVLDENPMKIEYIKLSLNEDEKNGRLFYKNKQGEKELKFGICKNEFSLFPEKGYPDMQMNVECPDNQYPCAASGAWLDERKFAIRVQMTGKHLGGLYIMLGFTKDTSKLSVMMVKNTNCFLAEYNGQAIGNKL